MSTTSEPSILANLRGLIPRRIVNFAEALQVAEWQAQRLVDLVDDIDGVQERHLALMPRISVTREELEVSGTSHWNGRSWVIALAKTDSHARQRFTLLHEFKHIIDHGSTGMLYTGSPRATAAEQAEMVADYFAGCALVGRRELKSAWGNGIQRAEDLAAHFNVSLPAIQVRLAQTGLDRVADKLPSPRCARPTATPRGHAQRFRPAQSVRRFA